MTAPARRPSRRHPRGPYEHKGSYTAPAPVLPMPALVAYVCVDCGAVFSHREPFEAHGLYLDHIAMHDEDPADPEPFTPAELAALEDDAARHTDEVPD